MFKKIAQTYKEVKFYIKNPKIISLLVILILVIISFGINIIFAPPLLTVIIIIVFLGVATSVLNSYLKLIRLSTEAELKDVEFRAATKNIKDGILVYDTDFRILNLNRATEEILEVKTEEILGKKITPEFIKKSRFRALTQVLFPTLAPTATQLSEDTWPQVVRLELEDPPLKLHTTLNKLEGRKGEAIGFLKIIRDETREKEIVESKSEFVSVAAHQLRTPLTALNWSLENLSKEDSKLEKKLRDSVMLTERMLKIVNDLLEAAKIEEGRFGYKFEDVEVTGFLNQIISHIKPIAREYGIKVIFDPPPKKYETRIDPSRLGIAITNLLDNAIRYNTKDGNVTITLEESPAKSPFIKIVISDTGVGIPKEDLSKIFNKFHRGSNIVRMEPNGSGLGLYITRNIIKRHGGEIDLESQPGRGTKIWFTLPIDKSLVPEKGIVYEE